MSFDDWLHKFITEHSMPIALAVSTVAGLMASFGKALRDGTMPDRRWWGIRAAPAAFFWLASLCAAELFSLTIVEMSFLNSLLMYIGFGAIQAMENRAIKMLEGDDKEGGAK
jgi:hypothetical protein